MTWGNGCLVISVRQRHELKELLSIVKLKAGVAGLTVSSRSILLRLSLRSDLLVIHSSLRGKQWLGAGVQLYLEMSSGARRSMQQCGGGGRRSGVTGFGF